MVKPVDECMYTSIDEVPSVGGGSGAFQKLSSYSQFKWAIVALRRQHEMGSGLLNDVEIICILLQTLIALLKGGLPIFFT
jgi:hypothetical protein